tara:strand:+ start:40 stop:306 length:267 start_codon:yes stop_codon:yes gene_type:complete
MKDERYFIAIHTKVVVAYILSRPEPELPLDYVGFRGDWTAYVIPVEDGETQAQAAESGRGNKLRYEAAKALLGSVVENWEARGYKYRK